MRNTTNARHTLACIMIFLFAVCGEAYAQFKLPKIELPTAQLGLDKILREESPLTTSFSDALYEIAFIDDYDPKKFTPLTSLEKGPNGGFILRPGLYELDAQSYCLKAGTHGPSGGNGYLYAPLKGPRSEIIHAVLKNSASHPNIPQSDIQVLLWAIIARTKISDMSRDMQQTAAKLLTSKQIFDLNGGALGLLPKDLVGDAFDKLSAPLQKIVRAEANLRSSLTSGNPTYQQIEQIAMLAGDLDPAEEDGPKVPSGRWSYHPDGYFVRYLPSGYSRTQIQVDVPEKHTIERDALKRIVLIADPHGNRIETEYDDSIPPATVPGDPGVKAYALRTIRFIHPDPQKGILTAEWNDAGWVFVGIPGGQQTTSSTSGERRYGLPTSVYVDIPGGDSFADRFGGMQERYENARGRQQQIQDFHRRMQNQNRDRSWRDVEDVTDVGHYKDGLDKALGSDLSAKGDWIGEHLGRVTNAWKYAACRLGGGCDDDGGNSSQSGNGGRRIREFDPSGGAAVPSSTGRQRLGMSSRSSR